ncbi:hypothetical protein WJX84_003760 [Apatococcus fuscideae]|uniref:DNA repair protein XRCC4 n=1 Tax=Apatococcus fuscideae TaxID=2026836 RepID=A0AAW1SNI5_9CHLO
MGKSEPEGSKLTSWMTVMRSALSGQRGYDFKLDEQTALKVEVRFFDPESDIRRKVMVELDPCDDQAAAMCKLLSFLAHDHTSMQDATTKLSKTAAATQIEARRAQEKLSDLQQNMHQKEEDLYCKFARLLSEKKNKCRALQDRIIQLEQEVQAAKSAPLQAPAEAGSSGDEDGNVTSGATDPHVSSENDSEEEILSGTLNPPGPSSQQPDSSQELLRGRTLMEMDTQPLPNSPVREEMASAAVQQAPSNTVGKEAHHKADAAVDPSTSAQPLRPKPLARRRQRPSPA